VTGDTFLAVMDNTPLRHVSVGTVFQSDGASPHFSRRVRVFVDRGFLIVGQEDGDSFLSLFVPQIWLLCVFPSVGL